MINNDESNLIYFLLTSEEKRELWLNISYLEPFHFKDSVSYEIYKKISALRLEKHEVDAYSLSKELNTEEEKRLIEIVENAKTLTLKEAESHAANIYKNFVDKEWKEELPQQYDKYLKTKVATVDLNKIIVTHDDYDKIKPSERFYPWLPAEGGVVMVYSITGTGKTTFVLHLSKYLLGMKKFYEWEYLYSRKPNILYIDGEMSMSDQAESFKKIGLSDDSFKWITHERLVIRLENREDRNVILSYCKEKNIDILIIDTITSNLKVTNISRFLPCKIITDFLLECRRNKITVIFTNQGNKITSFRGHSTLQDELDTTILLSTIYNDEEVAQGFKIKFEKRRTREKLYPRPFIVKISEEDGKDVLKFDTESDIEYRDVLGLVRESGKGGIYSKEISDELCISKVRVSRYKKRMQQEGLVKIYENRRAPIIIDKE